MSAWPIRVGQVELRGDPGEGTYYVTYMPRDFDHGPLTTHEVEIPGMRSVVKIDLTASGALYGIEVLH